MKEIYAALLLHKSGKPVDEEGIKKVLSATGAEIDESKVKSLIASLKDINIDEELDKAVAVSAAPAGVARSEGAEAKAEESPKEERREAAAEGLSALFG